MSHWECTYSTGPYGLGQETKTCWTSCCEHDCCPEDGSSTGVIVGVTIPLSILLILLLVCCRICLRRRAASRSVVVTAPPRAIIIASTTVTRAGAPVPEHQGYDQTGYVPSAMPGPAVYQPPPPYAEQPPKANV